MSNNKDINLVVFGIGNVGSTLMDQILKERERLNENLNLSYSNTKQEQNYLVFVN